MGTGTQVAIGEGTKISLKIMITIITAVVGFTFWLTMMYADVQELKKDVSEMKKYIVPNQRIVAHLERK